MRTGQFSSVTKTTKQLGLSRLLVDSTTHTYIVMLITKDTYTCFIFKKNKSTKYRTNCECCQSWDWHEVRLRFSFGSWDCFFGSVRKLSLSCILHFFQVMSSYDQMSQGLQIFSFAKIQFANIQFAWVKHLSEFNFFKVQNR